MKGNQNPSEAQTMKISLIAKLLSSTQRNEDIAAKTVILYRAQKGLKSDTSLLYVLCLIYVGIGIFFKYTMQLIY